MRKRILIAAVVAVGLLASGCKAASDVDPSETEGTASVRDSVTVEKGAHYLITRESGRNYCYQIFNYSGAVVRQQSFEWRVPRISVLENGVLDIAVGYGTGVIQHTYYDVWQDRFSEEYWDVAVCDGEKVAFVDYPAGSSMDERRLVVRDVFEKEAFYQEYSLDFAPVVQPIVDADFVNRGKGLYLVYQDGNEEKATLLDLMGE